jgi:hypothetical protein
LSLELAAEEALQQKAKNYRCSTVVERFPASARPEHINRRAQSELLVTQGASRTGFAYSESAETVRPVSLSWLSSFHQLRYDAHSSLFAAESSHKGVFPTGKYCNSISWVH